MLHHGLSGTATNAAGPSLRITSMHKASHGPAHCLLPSMPNQCSHGGSARGSHSLGCPPKYLNSRGRIETDAASSVSRDNLRRTASNMHPPMTWGEWYEAVKWWWIAAGRANTSQIELVSTGTEMCLVKTNRLNEFVGAKPGRGKKTESGRVESCPI